jgi:hypothetical protein
MKKIYAIFMADEQGNFERVLVVPKPYYLTKEEAESARQELIKTVPIVTLENTLIKKFLVEVNKEQNTKNSNQLN